MTNDALPEVAPPQSARAPSPSDDRAAPRLSIIHLMILTAAVGLLLIPSREMVGEGLGDLAGPMPVRLRLMIAVHWLSRTALSVLPLTALGCWAVGRARGERFPATLGHWVLLWLGFRSLLGVGLSVFWLAGAEELLERPYGLEALRAAYVLATLATGIAAAAMVRLVAAQREKLLLILLSARMLSWSVKDVLQMLLMVDMIRMGTGEFALYYASFVPYFLTWLAVVAATVAAIARRPPDGLRRDWIDRLGLWLLLLTELHSEAWSAAFYFLA